MWLLDRLKELPIFTCQQQVAEAVQKVMDNAHDLHTIVGDHKVSFDPSVASKLTKKVELYY